eukprot:12223763-Alexandrium_andersonii.AAC.1
MPATTAERYSRPAGRGLRRARCLMAGGCMFLFVSAWLCALAFTRRPEAECAATQPPSRQASQRCAASA